MASPNLHTAGASTESISKCGGADAFDDGDLDGTPGNVWSLDAEGLPGRLRKGLQTLTGGLDPIMLCGAAPCAKVETTAGMKWGLTNWTHHDRSPHCLRPAGA